METTKVKKEFKSLSDSIVKLIIQKHEEIEAEAKQLLNFEEEALKRKNKELVERSAKLDSEKEKLALCEKQYGERRRELEIYTVVIGEERDTVAEQLIELELKDLGFRLREEEIESRRIELDRILENFKADAKKLEERNREIEGDLERQRRELDSNRKKLKLKEIELKRNCNGILMDGKNLQIFLNECCQNHEKMGDEVSALLRLSKDPAKLVLDALEGFFPPYLRKNGNGEEFSGHIVQRSCILLLEQLLKISPEIKFSPEVNNEARRLSCVWITKLKLDSKHSMEILGFLFVLAVYNVISVFSVDEIFNYVKIVAGFEQVPELCRLLGMKDKITGLIQELVERKQRLLAIRYAINYNLIEKFPLDSLLKDHIESCKVESAAIIKSGNNSRMTQNRARTRTIFNLRAAITCIEKYNISSEYSSASLRQMIASLNMHDEVEHKEAVVHAPAASAVAKAPQLQHTNTASSVPVVSVDTKSVVSTQGNTSDNDPLPKRRKLLDEKSISTDNANPKKQVCVNENDLGALLRQDLDFCLMRDKVVGILRSSSNPAGLVLDVMRSRFLPTPSSASEEIPIKCCISLLVELRGFAIEQCTCEEAKKFGVSWKLILREEKSCDPMKIACFLLFHDVYQLGLTIKAAQIAPMINSLDSPKHLHEVFAQIGLPQFLPDMIKKWIGSNHRVQAIRYIQALHLTDQFPPAQLINDHLHTWNKLADERYKNKQNSSHNQTLQEINYRIEGISIAVALVKTCNLESVYPIKQLEHSRNVLKSRKGLIQKASNSVASSENRSLKKNRRKRAREEPIVSSSEPPAVLYTHPLPQLQGMIGFNHHQLPPYLPQSHFNHFNHQRQSVNYGDLPGLFQNQGFIR